MPIKTGRKFAQSAQDGTEYGNHLIYCYGCRKITEQRMILGRGPYSGHCTYVCLECSHENKCSNNLGQLEPKPRIQDITNEETDGLLSEEDSYYIQGPFRPRLHKKRRNVQNLGKAWDE